MIELVYRGINYKSQRQKEQTQKIYTLTPSDKCGAKKSENLNRLISIKPLHYYTYRGVSYTKTVVSDSRKKILLDIDRQ